MVTLGTSVVHLCVNRRYRCLTCCSPAHPTLKAGARSVNWASPWALLPHRKVAQGREIRQRSAGLRTHALVGVGAALFSAREQVWVQ